MRNRVIDFLKTHHIILKYFWRFASISLNTLSWFVPINNKNMIFCSFGGRKFDDSPKAIYDEVCSNSFFDDWNLIWVFVEPGNFIINRGEIVKIDTIKFFIKLLSSKVWISNSGMTRGIDFHKKGIIEVETWHGTPLKKICGEENTGSNDEHLFKKNIVLDDKTIRCAQSEYDLNILARVFGADKRAFLLSDLPRNDALFKYGDKDVQKIRHALGIPNNKKVILYVPTYREYSNDDSNSIYLRIPINLYKWKKILGNDYVLLFRAHYAIRRVFNVKEDDFVYDLTDYPVLNDLYVISDIMISDYSSSFIDYSILERPMLCFAYDLEEYQEKRGLYVDLAKELPCEIDRTEDDILNRILSLNYEEYSQRTRCFKNKYAPFAGNASKKIIEELITKLSK